MIHTGDRRYASYSVDKTTVLDTYSTTVSQTLDLLCQDDLSVGQCAGESSSEISLAQ